MGKSRLDRLLVHLKEPGDEFRNLLKTNMLQYSLTSQAVYSIELNAHPLVYLVLLVIEGKLPKEVLAVDRFHSQSWEAIFRSARAFSSKISSGVNFTVLQFMNLADKLSLFQKSKLETSNLLLRRCASLYIIKAMLAVRFPRMTPRMHHYQRKHWSKQPSIEHLKKRSSMRTKWE